MKRSHGIYGRVARAAAGMLLGTAVLLAAQPLALPVCAGEQLGATDFDDGVGLPWHIVESEPAKMDFELKDGKYYITIINPGGASAGGEDRWDCQFRHRGLTIVSGHEYRVQYEITASNSGKYYTKIGNLAGDVEIWHNMSNGYDLDATWDPIQINANETKKVEVTFTAAQSMDVAEWAFHLGGDGQYTPGGCFPAGTVISFDNMSLTDLSSDQNDYVKPEPWERAGVLTNQLGYMTEGAKKATLLCDRDSAVNFNVIDSSGKSVYSGKSQPFGLDPDSGDKVHILDFSAVKNPGRYYIEAANGAGSREFTVGDTESYSAMLYDALNYFYQNRAGVDILGEYISSGEKKSLARAAGHVNETATIEQTWGYNASSGTQEVSGGWYDAGDHGKYVVNGGISLWLLQNQYEAAVKAGTESAYADQTMNIPENNNGCPDLLDEARYELEWMFKMMVQDGDCKDMVYHKVHDIKWTGLAVAPAEDDMERIIKPPTTAATLNLCACAAQAARLWADIDPAFAKECLDVAERTYAAALKHPEMYAPLDESVGGGAYGDNSVTDEFYWATTELYITTGSEEYLERIRNITNYYAKIPLGLSGGESVDTYGCFDWGHVAALGNLSLCLNSGVEGHKEAAAAVIKAADRLIEKEAAQGYGQPYGSSTIAYNDSDEGYAWGSNSFVADNSIVIAYAYLMSGDKKYYDGVLSGMDYLLGRNPMDYSYVTGYGSHAAEYPHHRYWSNLIDSNYPKAPGGVLVGGPNSGMQDPWVKGSGWKKGTIAPAKCYLDHIEAWSVNECTINWNAPLAWLTGFVLQYTDSGIAVGATGNGGGLYINPEKSEPAEYSGEVDGINTKIGRDESVPGGKTANAGEDPHSASGLASKEDKDGGNNTLLIVLIVVSALVVVVVISIEVFLFKMAKLKAGNSESPSDTVYSMKNGEVKAGAATKKKGKKQGRYITLPMNSAKPAGEKKEDDDKKASS